MTLSYDPVEVFHTWELSGSLLRVKVHTPLYISQLLVMLTHEISILQKSEPLLHSIYLPYNCHGFSEDNYEFLHRWRTQERIMLDLWAEFADRKLCHFPSTVFFRVILYSRHRGIREMNLPRFCYQIFYWVRVPQCHFLLSFPFPVHDKLPLFLPSQWW